MIVSRRSFLRGIIAAPIVITTPGLLMPVRPLNPWIRDFERWYFYDVGKPGGDATVMMEVTRFSMREIRFITGIDIEWKS